MSLGGFLGGFLGGARNFWGNPYLNSTAVLFDDFAGMSVLKGSLPTRINLANHNMHV